MTKKKSKIKTQNIIIVINIVILLAITLFYATRLIRFYLIENPKVEKNLNLVETIIQEKNVVSAKDGLYKEDDIYTFKGKKVNNYLEYSGHLFRIVSINNNQIKLITNDSLTNLVWGVSQNYENSYIKNWLNGKEINTGIFYTSLNDPDKYLVDTSFCVQKLNENSKNCDKKINEKIGLLSLIEYKAAGGSKSYLNSDNYWWLSNPSSEGVWYVSNNGLISDEINTLKEYYSYGVRPVITINGNTNLISGDGTIEKPYIIEKDEGKTLKEKNTGKYIKYSNSNWRIIEQNSNYVKVVLDGFIKENNQDYTRIYNNKTNVFSPYNAIGYYLNNDFYKTLDNNYMVSGKLYTNRYDSTVDYDYTKIFDSVITTKVGLMQIGDLYMNDYSDYFLLSRTSTYSNTVYKVMKDNSLYADLPSNEAKLRPVIFLKPDSPISSGNGSKNNPYIIG